MYTRYTRSIPSVGVKEGLSCVFSRAKWRGKARILALQEVLPLNPSEMFESHDDYV